MNNLGFFTTQELQKKACELAGLTMDEAFAIDEYSNTKKGELLPDFTISEICDVFYTKIYTEVRPKYFWFRDLFTVNSKKNKDEAAQDLAEYLLQRFGGKCYYSTRRGFPDLIKVHCPLGVIPVENTEIYEPTNYKGVHATRGYMIPTENKLTFAAADLWCEYMYETLLQLRNSIAVGLGNFGNALLSNICVEDVFIDRVMNYFKFTSYYIVLSVEDMNNRRLCRTYDT